ncbi:hypothetical protein D3M96_19680 [Alcaligenes aquatilis]|uniref:Uncharacterized protein n=1 Tax=Alcaligenes aquatilis TaxID=323284 RepID=A0A3G2HZK1_9BURK|nr:hypothetical protein D3M96_19680 [Alcaligenes aquatilis]
MGCKTRVLRFAFHVLGLKTLAMFCSAAIRLFWLRKDTLALSYLSTKIGDKKTADRRFEKQDEEGL